jgi:hypothetical protein
MKWWFGQLIDSIAVFCMVASGLFKRYVFPPQLLLWQQDDGCQE